MTAEATAVGSASRWLGRRRWLGSVAVAALAAGWPGKLGEPLLRNFKNPQRRPI